MARCVTRVSIMPHSSAPGERERQTPGLGDDQAELDDTGSEAVAAAFRRESLTQLAFVDPALHIISKSITDRTVN